jgi:hypothetical protein
MSRGLVIVLFLGGSVLFRPVSAEAVDNGAWQQGCATGKVCFPNNTTSCTGTAGLRMASAIRDSNFSNDFYSNGGTLNDNAGCMWNRTSISVRAYAGADYNTSLGSTACLVAGNSVGPFTKGTAAGMSSFKSC